MSATEPHSGSEPGADGFVDFVRAYTKTWVHALAAAALTAFGTLTVVNRWFAALALASYLVPLVVLYARWRRTSGELGMGPGAADQSASRPSNASRDDQPRTQEDEPPAASASVSEDGSDAATASDTDETASDSSHHEPAVDAGTAPDEEQSTADVPHSRPDRDGEWTTTDAPTGAPLSDVTITDDGHSYAVGDGGVVLASSDAGDWHTVLEDGPAAAGNDLTGVAATDDGGAVWIDGDSGTVARIDTATDRHTDYTAPTGITDNWLGIAVGGDAGTETILLSNGSGEILRGRYRRDPTGADDTAASGSGELAWDEPLTPGSGSSLSGVDLADDAVGYCCDTNNGVFETTDGGTSFSRIGLDDAAGTFTNIVAATPASPSPVLVSADDGVVHRYDGTTWTPERITDTAVTGLSVGGERLLACTDDGAVFERQLNSTEFSSATGIADSLQAVAVGPPRAIAVGSDGTIVERQR
ncbi:hypothetical protein [Natrialba asiatica]|uniref:Glycosyl hydrolase n=1 Tax=Natrialba asiatica (strain ATCC 700177 / DSM 12278 / JCM 9576 / FERM P-10747 / NBRC 102637 / 172P1) TaxID=29540 RepID=M0AZ69_NATA1|nr:hypothetical protein [Natrialba asiatica]ELZ03956.1 hypothetical protein C481_04281 [Natrialba asiatica DSM 12278]